MATTRTLVDRLKESDLEKERLQRELQTLMDTKASISAAILDALHRERQRNAQLAASLSLAMPAAAPVVVKEPSPPAPFEYTHQMTNLLLGRGEDPTLFMPTSPRVVAQEGPPGDVNPDSDELPPIHVVEEDDLVSERCVTRDSIHAVPADAAPMEKFGRLEGMQDEVLPPFQPFRQEEDFALHNDDEKIVGTSETETEQPPFRNSVVEELKK